jgi:long-chain acyl-CoA synthetase
MSDASTEAPGAARLTSELSEWSRGEDAELARAILDDAERLAREPSAAGEEVWRLFLDTTASSRFVSALGDPRPRARWAEVTFAAVRAARYTLERMLEARVRACGERVFLAEARGGARGWTFALVRERARASAAALLRQPRASGAPPRVALLGANSLELACADLACLLHGLFVAPIDPHAGVENLAWIFERLGVDTVIADAGAVGALEAVRARAGSRPFVVAHLAPDARPGVGGDFVLDEAAASLSRSEIDAALASHPRLDLREPATVLFTSGSTGRPKGVLFTLENLVTKRFARGAALPRVGEHEVLLTYLPLFHTFGRYLELLGMLYWGGTYVLAGNPSAETLMALMLEVRPTGLVSVPVRWAQIREAFLRRTDAGADRELGAPSNEQARRALHAIVGDRLRWGLSAAGYLDPRVFRFFNRLGVELCSGFGMTEATGGITMTPPGQYVDRSVGVPLPGMRTRLTGAGELEIGGPYVARYLDDDGADAGDGVERWLRTGDVFRMRAGGFLEIVDRVKDIYKSSKGQTIAPRPIEQRFEGVPGIRRVFLVGDGREVNTLLVVPDREDPVLARAKDDEEVRAYFDRIVGAVNAGLPKHERVVGLTLLARDFSADQGELTPKGTYRRKVILDHFAVEIAELYRSRSLERRVGGLVVRLPRWLLRDLGLLEADVGVETDSALVVARTGARLRVGRPAAGRASVGDLDYAVEGDIIDLGLFVRQPLLWVGNPELAAFCPCKEGWDLSLERERVAPQIFLPDPARPLGVPLPAADSAGGGPTGRGLDADVEPRLARAHRLAVRALLGPREDALAALDELGRLLPLADRRLGAVIRRRLEALAHHDDEAVRSLAYSTLLLNTPAEEHARFLPAFVAAGRSFLTDESIERIARSSGLERRRLEAYRQRLHGYRARLAGAGTSAATRTAMGRIFELLGNFARFHPEYFPAVREELTIWSLFEADPELARRARDDRTNLVAWWREHVLATLATADPGAWEGKLAFQDGLSAPERARLAEVLAGPSGFLEASLMLAVDGARVRAGDLPAGGVWVTRMPSTRAHPAYRISVNTTDGRHYDLRLLLRPDLATPELESAIDWRIALSGYPYGQPAAPRLGVSSPELGALSVEYVAELAASDRLRELARDDAGAPWPWRVLFVRALSAFFTAWRNSGGRIVPGVVDPSNVIVFEPDDREGALVLSALDFRAYGSPLSLVAPLLQGFYDQTAAQVPWVRDLLDPRWLFEACVEALGREADAFLGGLADELETPGADAALRARLGPPLDSFRRALASSYVPPLALDCAVARYERWLAANPAARPEAVEQIVRELGRQYSLDRFGALCLCHLHRRTTFARAGERVARAFDALLEAMRTHPERHPTTMVEVAELQAAAGEGQEREAIGRVLFPHALPEQHPEVLSLDGGGGTPVVVLRSQVRDARGNRYAVREPIDAPEVGTVYRLFVTAGFGRPLLHGTRFLAAFDEQDELVAGACFTPESPEVVHLDGVVVLAALRDRSLSGALLEDLCARLASTGVEVLHTFYRSSGHYAEHGFRVDPHWGGLVRFLAGPEQDGAL